MTPSTKILLEQNVFQIFSNFEEFYTLENILGQGCVGLVKRAVKKDTGE
jgi:hypothetical protein